MTTIKPPIIIIVRIQYMSDEMFSNISYCKYETREIRIKKKTQIIIIDIFNLSKLIPTYLKIATYQK